MIEADPTVKCVSKSLYATSSLAAMRPEARPASIEEVLDSAVEQNLRAGEIVKNLRDFIMRGEPNQNPSEPA